MRDSAFESALPCDPSAGEDDAPCDSVTQLIALRDDAFDPSPTPRSDARPTTPVPSFYLFQAHHAADDPLSDVLAGRLEELADEPVEAVECALHDEVANDALAETTRSQTIIPRGMPSCRPPCRLGGVFALLGLLGRVPYLRRHPRDIPPGSIDHRRALLLALVDGHTSIGQLLQTSPLPVATVLEIVSELLETGVLGLRA